MPQMRKSTEAKIREIREEEQQFQRAKEGAFAQAEREHCKDEDISKLIGKRNDLIEERMTLQKRQKQIGMELARVAEDIRGYLEQFVPEDYREEKD